MKVEMTKSFFSGLAASVSLSARGILMASCALTGIAGLSGCTSEKHSEPNVELIQDMMDQPALKAQDFEPSDRTKGSSRLPPEGSVPQGYKPYIYHGDPQAAEKNLKNPLAGDFSADVLKLGEKKYNTYCFMCHGSTGKGDGVVAPKLLLAPPSLVTEKIRKMGDGGIFHIITDGQGGMSSYAYQLVNERDRWAMVNYIRQLQKQAN